MRIFDEEGYEVEIDANGNIVRKRKGIMRDGEVVRVPMQFADKQTIDETQAARQVLADRAAQVRAEWDQKVYAAHGMAVPAGQVAMLDSKQPYLPVGQRAGTVVLSDDIREAKQALVGDYNSRVSSAWRTPPATEGD